MLIQPLIDFEYEVSFYFLDNVFQYALFAPYKNKRWELIEYLPSPDDLLFAKRFVEWNHISHGIQRVDAFRLPDDSLLLVELEDFNPFLSLEALEKKKREDFIQAFIAALNNI